MVTNETKRKLLKQAWDMFNDHGISVIPDKTEGEIMEVTISFKSKGKLSGSITLSRPSEVGILSWLPDKEWMQLRDGVIPTKE